MHTFIIAEAGVNHNGDIDLAKKMVDAAADAKADAVKFQTFIPENVMSQFAEKAEYQKETTGAEESQLDMVRKLYIPFEGFNEIRAYCDEKGIAFMSTPFDLESLAFLSTMSMPYLKIPSGEITNLPLLIEAAKLDIPVILSTGMSNIDEIAYARKMLLDYGAPEVSLLHCNTAYPTLFEDANLRAMTDIKNQFPDAKVGYSDHTLGICCPIAAVAMGAEIIEKHFTLDRNMDGPDQSASLEPDELKEMVAAIRNIEQALGDGIKKPSESELKNKDVARKSIVAARDIKKGETFTYENLTIKRPGSGISPIKWFDVIGLTAKRDFAYDELIEL